MDFLSFEMKVQLAVGAALEVDPVAVLHEATMHSDYGCIRCIFSGKNNETIIVKVGNDNKTSVTKNSWGWVAHPMEWPTSLNYNTARRLFDEEFPNTCWSTVVLRQRSAHPSVGAEYVFTVAGGYVVVDVPTRTAYSR
jgi:hypothetical protein